MDAVNAFNHELFSLMDMKPPISRAKMISITKSAIKAMKLYKHVVQIVEKFIKKCKPEFKVAGLYVVDSIVRQSRHQFGVDKDVFGPRFTKNINGTFENLCLCPTEERSKIVRVLNLWQKNGVFKIDVIQPLLDMATSGSSGASAFADMDDPDPGSPPSPVKEAVTVVTANSVVATVPQLQNSDALAAVAQLFQSSQGQQLQQMLQTFQQQPGKPLPQLQPFPHQTQPLPLPQLQPFPHQTQPLPLPQLQPFPHQTHLQPQHQPQHQPQPHPPPHLPAQPTPSLLSQPQALPPGLGIATQHLPLPSSQLSQQKTAFDKVATLLDRFDYDDEPEGADESKKDESSSAPPTLGQPPPGFPQHMMGLTPDPTQVSLPPNGQLQGFGLLSGQVHPGMVTPLGQAHPGQPLPGTGPPGFAGAFMQHNDTFGQHMTQQQQDVNTDLEPSVKDGRHRLDDKRSPSGSRSPKRRRSRSNSRTRRSRHRRSRSRSRDHRRHSPRSRSLERREREKERERRQKGLPPPKAATLSVCTTTLWVGQLDKRTHQQDVACLLEEFGQIDSINMIPPRGCAYIVMVHRQDAFRALQKLSRGSHKVNQKAIKIAWALNKGIKTEFKQYWEVELGVTYIPWSKIRPNQIEEVKEGGMLDPDTLSPEWKDVLNSQEKPDDLSQNGRSDPMGEDTSETAAPGKVEPLQQPPAFLPGHDPPGGPPMGLPAHAFPPGPPPPFMRPGFNPMQIPPGFPPPRSLPLGPPAPPPSAGVGLDELSMDPAGPRNCSESQEGPNLYGHQSSNMGNQGSGPPGGPPGSLIPPSGGLLGARPGMIPLQRPPVHAPGPVPPPHMQRFPPPHGGPHGPHPPRGPPHHNMPPHMMPPHRGPHPPMMHQDGLPPPPGAPGGFGMGMPPPHGMRGPFPPHGPLPGGPPPPFMRGGPRGPEGPEEMDGRAPFRGERPVFRDRDPERDWERERFERGGRGRRFGDGGRGRGGGERMEERERFGGWQEEGGDPRGGGDWERDRRDWRERQGSPDAERERGRGGKEGERERGRSEGGERGRGGEVGEKERVRGEAGERERGRRDGAEGERGRRAVAEGERPKRPRTRERTSRWDTDDRLGDKAEAEPENAELQPQNAEVNSKPLPGVAAGLAERSEEPSSHSKDSSIEHTPSQQNESEPSAPAVNVTDTKPPVSQPIESTQEEKV